METGGQRLSDMLSQMAEERRDCMSEKRKIIVAVTQLRNVRQEIVPAVGTAGRMHPAPADGGGPRTGIRPGGHTATGPPGRGANEN